jgi:hypothetical protein
MKDHLIWEPVMMWRENENVSLGDGGGNGLLVNEVRREAGGSKDDAIPDPGLGKSVAGGDDGWGRSGLKVLRFSHCIRL